ncbi:putative coil containing protein [Vibrio phage 141O35-1]|nr:putative coil containing protein [Vibrio phage 141O35-1]CAH9014920.1 putative coil containing protein [Vibrio phage 141E35-1]
MNVYKLECINVQHAIIASLRIKGMGFKTVRLGKAVLTDAPMIHNVPSAISDAMARTTEATEFDMQVWSDNHE